MRIQDSKFCRGFFRSSNFVAGFSYGWISDLFEFANYSSFDRLGHSQTVRSYYRLSPELLVRSYYTTDNLRVLSKLLQKKTPRCTVYLRYPGYIYIRISDIGYQYPGDILYIYIIYMYIFPVGTLIKSIYLYDRTSRSKGADRTHKPQQGGRQNAQASQFEGG